MRDMYVQLVLLLMVGAMFLLMAGNPATALDALINFSLLFLCAVAVLATVVGIIVRAVKVLTR